MFPLARWLYSLCHVTQTFLEIDFVCNRDKSLELNITKFYQIKKFLKNRETFEMNNFFLPVLVF